MAIPTQNVTYQGAGPAFTGQILAQALSGAGNQNLEGTATYVLDGALTSATLNFIDGTQALPFTPSAVVAVVVGGTQGAAAVVDVITDAPANGVSTTIRFSAVGTNANTVKVYFRIIK